MKKALCLLTAFAALTVWSTQTIAQEEKENGHKKTVVAYTGKVVRLDRGDPAMVVVKTDKADLNVELGPTSFLETSKLTLEPNADLTVRGYETMRDGKSVFIATEVTSGTNVVRFRDADFKPLWTVKAVEQKPAAIVTYTGRVKTFTKADPAIVVLETEKGPVTTELAPMTFVTENKLMLSPDEAVTVRGYETTRDGKTIFVASEVTMPDRRIIKLRNDSLEPVWVKSTTTTETYKEADLTDLSGTVTVVETNDTPDGRYITIKTDDGPRVIALAPGTYLEKHRYVFAPGERVRVRGWHAHRHGARVFLAADVHRGDTVWRFRRPNGRVLWIEEK